MSVSLSPLYVERCSAGDHICRMARKAVSLLPPLANEPVPEIRPRFLSSAIQIGRYLGTRVSVVLRTRLFDAE